MLQLPARYRRARQASSDAISRCLAVLSQYPCSGRFRDVSNSHSPWPNLERSLALHDAQCSLSRIHAAMRTYWLFWTRRRELSGVRRRIPSGSADDGQSLSPPPPILALEPSSSAAGSGSNISAAHGATLPSLPARKSNMLPASAPHFRALSAPSVPK